MKKKNALGLSSLLMVLLASFALVPSASSSPGISENHFYFSMMGDQTSHAEQIPPIGNPTLTTSPTTSTPMWGGMNLTFSEPWELPGVGWIVNLTVLHETQGTPGYDYRHEYLGWVRVSSSYLVDGKGWLFLNDTGDVDCYTYNSASGVYWDAPGDPHGLNGTLAAALGEWPDPGPDGVPGTHDDGFGDGTNDTRGSSILYMSTQAKSEVWDPGPQEWVEMFTYNWTTVWTTGVAYDKVIQSGSLLNGVGTAHLVGQPWEFFAGLDHPGYGSVPHGHAYWNAYVTYVSAWSTFNVDLGSFGTLNLLLEEKQKHWREDCVLPDIKFDDEEVSISDVRRAGKAYDTYRTGLGPDGIPLTDDDIYQDDALWDAAADVKDPRGWVGISDVRRVAKDYLLKLTPQGIQ